MSATSRDKCRGDLAANALTPEAVGHLTREALGTIGLENLAPVKQLLKRFFSAQPWVEGDDAALADLVGPGSGWWRHEIDGRYAFEFGWRDGAFRLEVSPLDRDHAHQDSSSAPRTTAGTGSGAATDLAATFDGPVVPEATPNPRTIRFVTPGIHGGPSRWYESREDADDPRVMRLFDGFDEVANVLVGPDFVAVGLRRPDAWERLLDPMLHAVSVEFAQPANDAGPSNSSERARPAGAPTTSTTSKGHSGALDRAWRELGALQAGDPRDLGHIVAAASANDSATRQVAARLLIGADPHAAEAEAAWAELAADPSRAVRRAAVDAMVDAERPALRPLLETALGDPDAWIRWKALRGLVELGIEPSRARVEPLSEDPDFRVRLETARALRTAGD